MVNEVSGNPLRLRLPARRARAAEPALDLFLENGPDLAVNENNYQPLPPFSAV